MLKLSVNMYKKIYVKVLAEFFPYGGLKPKEIFWEDNIAYQIDRVICVEKAPPKSGGLLTKRYTCRFGENERYLYYDKANERWFIEVCLKE